MYFKLALRNAKRSVFDYLLYITTTVILLSFMFISNYVSLVANIEAGFQSASLPLLISVILVILVSYINKFMLKQRSKEFANYILLGMEKKKLVNMFLCEFSIIGLLCLIISTILCFGLCLILSYFLQYVGSQGLNIRIYFQSFLTTFIYFCVLDFFSIYLIKKKMYKLEIAELMVEKKRNQRLGDKKQFHLWGIVLLGSLLSLILFLFSILLLSNEVIMIIISFIFIPLSFAIFAFYKWFSQYVSLMRQKQPECLFMKERLYMIAKVTSVGNTNSTLNSIFCMCLFLSAMSFIFGTFMLQTKVLLLDNKTQSWMGFLQICLCIIFIVIYFSILSLQQIIDMQQQIKEFRILCYLGKSENHLKKLIKKQILSKLLLPTIMCFSILGVSSPFLNYKLNNTLPHEMSGFWIKAVAEFSMCFLFLYLLYYFVVYAISRNILISSIKQD